MNQPTASATTQQQIAGHLQQARKMQQEGATAAEILSVLQTAQTLAETDGLQTLLADVLFEKGHVWRRAGETGNAMIQFFDALHLAEQLNDTLRIGSNCIYLADGYMQTGAYTEGIQYNLRATQALQSIGEYEKLFWTQYSLINCYTGHQDYERALEHIHQSHQLIETTSISDKEVKKAAVDMLLGSILSYQQKYEQAFAVYEKALTVFKQAGNFHFYSGCLTVMAEAKIAQQKPEEVIALLADENIQAINAYNKLSILQSLSLAHETLHHHQTALQYYKQYKTLYEEIYNAGDVRKITTHNLKAEIEKRRQEAEKERRQKEELERAYALLEIEKQRSESLLHNILPEEVAEELKATGIAKAQHFENITVLFTDFVAFTTASERLSPQQLVDELHACFKAFDEIISRYNIEKIKTVGDAYLAVAGLPLPNNHHAADMVKAAMEIRDFMTERRKVHPQTFEIRIGIHSGSAVAGIVGVKKFAYDIWGDTVNTAARMEQNGQAGRVNISEETYELVRNKFTCEYRGEIEAKNKGKMKMYFVES